MTAADPPVVVVVDDDRRLADMYTDWLTPEYEVRTAYGGSGALDEIDDDVSVVLLDRKLPDMTGDEVLSALRSRDVDCRVAMVTGVRPDFDIVDLGFDAYVCKPCSRRELRDAVEQLVVVETYGAAVRHHYALASKKAALEVEKSDEELAASEEYEALLAELGESRTELARASSQLAVADYQTLFRDLSRDGATRTEAQSTRRTDSRHSGSLHE